MKFHSSWVVIIEVTLVFVTGLVINAASEHLPPWMDNPWLVWPFLLAVLVFTIGITVQLGSTDDTGKARPLAWNVPARNPNFTGRKEDLARLDKLLRQRATAAVHAIRGMGGVGKTQLAVEFCHRHASRYDIVWWISSETAALIPDQFRLLGKALGLEQPSDTAEAVELLRSHLHQQRRWLLVFDNADSTQDVRPYLPSGPGHVVITTRRAGFNAIGGVLDLDTLERRESLHLLAKRAPTLSSNQAGELAELLGDLPLGLEQAAAYLIQAQIPPPEYLDLLRTSPDGLADKGEDGQRNSTEKSLATLWTLSLTQIEERHPAAAQLLSICAYLSPEAIPLYLFTTGVDLPAQLGIAAAENTTLSHTVGVLVDYSLVQRSNGHMTVHRLVQLAVRRHVAAIDTTLPDLQHPLKLATTVLHANLSADVFRSPETWPRWRQLIPHVLASLDHYDQLSKVDPELASWLLDRAGTYFHVSGQFSEARLLLERALHVNETVHGPDHPNVATSTSNLALVLQELGQSEEARQLLERVLRIDEGVHGPNHPHVAISLGNLALVLQELGQSEEARPLLERALRIDEAVHGPDHPDVAISLSNLALALKELGQSEEARPLLERARRIRSVSSSSK
jgi:tetratricopeptide (TPR) repeat protein